jgi:GPH family glycoside/pentoside/hexuronide:cation symporter
MVYFLSFLLVLYSLITGVCQTFMANAEGVYMHRCVKEGELQAKCAAVTGLVVMLLAAVASTLLPRLMNTWGKESGGWSKIALVYGVPMAALGLVRFFFIKETAAPDAEEQQFGLLEGLKITVKSKYVFIFAGAMLLVNIVNNMSSTMGSYYFTYVIGNLDLMAVIGMSSLLAPFFLLLFPLAMRTIGGMQFIRIGLVVAALGNLIKFFAPTNLAVVVAGTLLSGVGANTVTMISGIFIIECMDHLEWKSGKHAEGMAGIFPNVAGKIGSGIGPAIGGILLSASEYIAGAAIQPEAVHRSIIALYSWIPAVLCVVSLIIACFYDLDKKIPKIHEDLAAGRTAAAKA